MITDFISRFMDYFNACGGFCCGAFTTMPLVFIGEIVLLILVIKGKNL